MKRFLSAALCLCLALGLVACGGSPSGSTQPKDYPAILAAARPQVDNENYVVFSYKDGAYFATGGQADQLTQEDIDSQGAMCLMMLGLDEADLDEAAFSVSLMNVQSYGIAIVKPAQGKTEAVTQGLQEFIDGQKAAQQNYLADQYAIAKAAKLEAQKTGEVVLVMRENQNDVASAIEDALK